ncbi:MAG: hypothetical protein Q9174_005392 [Haloplaca sp. 1 TL-2023]
MVNVPYDEIVQVREEVIGVMFPEWLFRDAGADEGTCPAMADEADWNIEAFQTWLRRRIRYGLRCQEKARESSLGERLNTLFGIRVASGVKESTQFVRRSQSKVALTATRRDSARPTDPIPTASSSK